MKDLFEWMPGIVMIVLGAAIFVCCDDEAEPPGAPEDQAPKKDLRDVRLSFRVDTSVWVVSPRLKDRFACGTGALLKDPAFLGMDSTLRRTVIRGDTLLDDEALRKIFLAAGVDIDALPECPQEKAGRGWAGDLALFLAKLAAVCGAAFLAWRLIGKNRKKEDAAEHAHAREPLPGRTVDDGGNDEARQESGAQAGVPVVDMAEIAKNLASSGGEVSYKTEFSMRVQKPEERND